MAAHSPLTTTVPPVPPDQPPGAWASWLRSMAEAINLLARRANNPAEDTSGGTAPWVETAGDTMTGALTITSTISAYNYWIVNRASTDAGQIGFGNANGPSILFGGNSSGNGGAVQLSTASQLIIQDLTPTNKFAFLTTTGQGYKPGGGTWADISDIRTKDEKSIAEYKTGLDAVLQLNPISYRKNGRGGTAIDGRTYVGLIANQAREVMPEMVGVKLEKLEGGDPEPTEILTLEATALIYALVNCIKELTARIDGLERQ